MAFGIVVENEKAVIDALQKFSKASQNKVTRTAMRPAMTPARKAAKGNTPVDTGQMKKSITSKVKTYPKRGVIFGLIGIKKDSKNPETGRNPAKYLHLVLFGHRIAAGGTLSRADGKQAAESKAYGVRGEGGVIGNVRGNDFLTPALRNSEQTVINIFSAKLREGIAKEARRLAAKSKAKKK